MQQTISTANMKSMMARQSDEPVGEFALVRLKQSITTRSPIAAHSTSVGGEYTNPCSCGMCHGQQTTYRLHGVHLTWSSLVSAAGQGSFVGMLFSHNAVHHLLAIGGLAVLVTAIPPAIESSLRLSASVRIAAQHAASPLDISSNVIALTRRPSYQGSSLALHALRTSSKGSIARRGATVCEIPLISSPLLNAIPRPRTYCPCMMSTTALHTTGPSQSEARRSIWSSTLEAATPGSSSPAFNASTLRPGRI